jgi:FixJ family two-component response regulator
MEARSRIAIVDDDRSMCTALQRLLRLAGFDVEAFPSGEAFLGSLPAGTPDCLILDLQMPGMTGFEVQVRLAQAHVAVPVVTITGHDSPAAQERALAGGARVYLRKPVCEEELLAAIGRCIGRRPPGRGPQDRNGSGNGVHRVGEDEP